MRVGLEEEEGRGEWLGSFENCRYETTFLIDLSIKNIFNSAARYAT